MIQSDPSKPLMLRTARLILRLPEGRDIPEIFRYFQENEERFVPTHPPKETEFFTESFWADRIRKVNSEFKDGKSAKLFLFDVDNDTEIIGTTNLSDITRGVFQACYIGYDLSGGYESQGLMTEGLQAVIDYAFSVLNLHRLMANYQPYNIRSGNVLTRLGFVIEGTAKDYLLINGRWRDHVLTSLTNPRWKKM